MENRKQFYTIKVRNEKTHTKQNFVKVNETYVEDNKCAKDLRIRKHKIILV